MEPQHIWQNQNWLVVDKPAEWLTVPSRLGDKDERPCLGRYLEKSMNCRLWPVHRLDFEVSGLVLFALNPNSHRAANGWFENHLVQKNYQALSLGSVAQEFFSEQKWQSRLVRGKRRSFVADHGQESLTHAICVGETMGHYQWKLQPLTGRSHQLRVEMSRHGFAILGDILYGGSPWSKPGIALRACSLNFSAITQAERFDLPERLAVMDLVEYLR